MTGFDPELNSPVPLPLDDRAGPAARLARERGEEIVSAALLEFDRTLETSHAGRGWASRATTWAAAAAALLVIVGGAAAARYYFHFGERAPAAPAAAAATHATHAAPAAPAPEAESGSALPEIEPENVEPERGRAPVAKSVRGASAPEDLLQKANHLRAVSQFRDAAATYAQVYERFPRTLSAYVARVAGASIELEHLSNPTRARGLLEQALRDQPHGALDLEARQGLSVALRDLEDRAAEARALQALVVAHPDSPAARRAQVRLRELGDHAE